MDYEKSKQYLQSRIKELIVLCKIITDDYPDIRNKLDSTFENLLIQSIDYIPKSDVNEVTKGFTYINIFFKYFKFRELCPRGFTLAFAMDHNILEYDGNRDGKWLKDKILIFVQEKFGKTTRKAIGVFLDICFPILQSLEYFAYLFYKKNYDNIIRIINNMCDVYEDKEEYKTVDNEEVKTISELAKELRILTSSRENNIIYCRDRIIDFVFICRIITEEFIKEPRGLIEAMINKLNEYTDDEIENIRIGFIYIELSLKYLDGISLAKEGFKTAFELGHDVFDYKGVEDGNWIYKHMDKFIKNKFNKVEYKVLMSFLKVCNPILCTIEKFALFYRDKKYELIINIVEAIYEYYRNL